MPCHPDSLQQTVPWRMEKRGNSSTGATETFLRVLVSCFSGNIPTTACITGRRVGVVQWWGFWRNDRQATCVAADDGAPVTMEKKNGEESEKVAFWDFPGTHIPIFAHLWGNLALGRGELGIILQWWGMAMTWFWWEFEGGRTHLRWHQRCEEDEEQWWSRRVVGIDERMERMYNWLVLRWVIKLELSLD